jgi:ribA/ribD-fused uncharacterized protein
MNLYELKRIANKIHEENELRKGQAFMHMLPLAMYREVLNTEYDCYFRDNKLDDCFNYLMKFHDTKIDTLFVDCNNNSVYEDDDVIAYGKNGTIEYDMDTKRIIGDFIIRFDDGEKATLSSVPSSEIEVVVNIFDSRYDFLSNSYDSKVYVFNHTFRNAEAAFQDAKLRAFVNLKPSEAKELGRNVELTKDWEDIRYGIMEEVVYGKFTQNEELKKKLKETGNKRLIYVNKWHDNIWGECNCNKCKDKTKTNLLGKILMEVRTNL